MTRQELDDMIRRAFLKRWPELGKDFAINVSHRDTFLAGMRAAADIAEQHDPDDSVQMVAAIRRAADSLEGDAK